MTVYIFTLMIIVALILIFSINGTSTRKEFYFLVLSTSILVFISTFRALTVGTDTLSYSEIFYYASNRSFYELINGTHGVDKGYLILNKIISFVSNSEYTVMFVNSLVISGGIAYFIRKNSTSKFLSVYLYITLYYFSVSLNIVRQFLVISLFIIGFEKLKQNKNLLFIFIILVASTIHSTALVLLPTLLLFKIKPNHKYMKLIFLSVSIVTLSLYIYPELVFELAGRYAKYEGTAYFEARVVGGVIFIWIIQLILYMFMVGFLRRNEGNLTFEIRQRIFISSVMVLISVMIGILGTKISILSRLTYYFDIFMILLVPDFIKYKIKEKQITVIIIYLLLFAYFIYKLSTGGSGVVPYKFMWY